MKTVSDTKRNKRHRGRPGRARCWDKLGQSGKRRHLARGCSGVGHRFHGDFQGIENWTTGSDVKDFLKRIHVEVNFRFEPYRGGVFVSPDLRRREMRTREPLFYLIERGSEAGCLDYGLLRQAESAGVKLMFNARSWNVDQGGIIAVGPRAADMIAKGVVFETNLADEAYASLTTGSPPRATLTFSSIRAAQLLRP